MFDDDKTWLPSWKPKFTARNHAHRVDAKEVTYALSFRGPWGKTWQEWEDGVTTTFTHGRKVVSVHNSNR